MTGAEVRQRAAAAILAAKADAAEKARKKELRLATRAAKAAQKAEAAVARAAKKVLQASRPATSKRTRKPAATAESVPVMSDETAVEPVAGVKRRAEAPVPLAAAGGSDAAQHMIQKRIRPLLHKPE